MTLPTLWNDGTTGESGSGSNWSGGVAPDGTTNASIAGSGVETATVSGTNAVNVLTLDDPNATLSVSGFLAAYGGLVASAVREIDVYGTLLVGAGLQTIDDTTINLSGGTLTTNPASQQAAVLTLGPSLVVNSLDGVIGTADVVGDGIVNLGQINVSGFLTLGGYDGTSTRNQS
jgi:hypothetical protein